MAAAALDVGLLWAPLCVLLIGAFCLHALLNLARLVVGVLGLFEALGRGLLGQARRDRDRLRL